MSPSWEAECDATGLRCPLPVLRARKALLRLGPGAVLRLLATDPMAAIDVAHFCAEGGHALVSFADAGGGTTAFLIRRGG
ncbi:MAG: sulfurtransferase TusA family protein [Rhodobacteraceae bacterium]|nr:sulfurtransferase TusA family protein [Paracoccaceae bacterium]